LVLDKRPTPRTKILTLVGQRAEKGNFGQKSKFWSKIKILVKNKNSVQKSEFS